MALLLDTQIIIWMESMDFKIPENTKLRVLSDPDLYVSKASIWEMAIKIKIGKLSLDEKLSQFVNDFLRDYHVKMLNINLRHIYYTNNLPFHHRDPFDRLLIAQSYTENIPIVSSDDLFDAYGVRRIWK